MIQRRTSAGLSVLSAGPERPAAPVLVLLHGFGDEAGMFAPLFDEPALRDFRLLAPDLAGCGESPSDAIARTIEDHAGRIVALIEAEAPAVPVGLVGHSLGAAIAVVAAERLGRQCLGLFSIEGNLTAKDAYFSGQAGKWDDPEAFKAHLLKGTRNMAHFKPELARYAAALDRADASALWYLGRDAQVQSHGNVLGERYRALACPTRYYWSRKTTPAATSEYLASHRLATLEYVDGGHWPSVAAPGACAAAIAGFFATLVD